MRPNDIARHWLGERPLVVLVCGSSNLGQLLIDDLVRVFRARTDQEREALQAAVALDVAIIEEEPWPGGDAVAISRELRTQGVGTVLVARTHAVAKGWLRDRIAIAHDAPDLQQKLFESAWFACFETEIVRRALEEPGQPLQSEAPRARYVQTQQGQLEASKSTMTYVFGDLDLSEPPPGLRAPDVLEPVEASQSRNDGKTSVFRPSANLLETLRREGAASKLGSGAFDFDEDLIPTPRPVHVAASPRVTIEPRSSSRVPRSPGTDAIATKPARRASLFTIAVVGTLALAALAILGWRWIISWARA